MPIPAAGILGTGRPNGTIACRLRLNSIKTCRVSSGGGGRTIVDRRRHGLGGVPAKQSRKSAFSRPGRTPIIRRPRPRDSSSLTVPLVLATKASTHHETPVPCSRGQFVAWTMWLPGLSVSFRSSGNDPATATERLGPRSLRGQRRRPGSRRRAPAGLPETLVGSRSQPILVKRRVGPPTGAGADASGERRALAHRLSLYPANAELQRRRASGTIRSHTLSSWPGNRT